MHICPVSPDPPRRLALAILVAASLIGGIAAAAPLAGPEAAPRVTVSIVGDRSAIAPGGAMTIGVRFELEPHWHVYWQNPGDSGEAPRLRWSLPDGWTAGPIAWPAPTRIETGPLVNYGYEGDAVLPVTISAPADASSPGRIGLKASWLVCREDCIPGKAVFEFDLPVAAEAPLDAEWGPRFAALDAARPPSTPASFERDGDAIRIALPELAAPPDARIDLLSAVEGVVPPTAEATVQRPEGGGLVLTLPLSDTAPGTLESIVGLIQIGADPSTSRAIDARPGRVVAATPPATRAPVEQTSIGVALLFALLGGLLLNLMPCVFPVLSLKALAFVEHAGDDPRVVRRQGWLFTAGVLVAFWVLAGALVALRAGGDHLGWGFQLQSPGFVAVLTVLIFGLALSLAGVFEVGLSLTAVGGREQWGAFGTGVLATVVATPCTAPFMGPAVGYALTQPAVASMGVFTALGLGMALPYLVLSHAPALLARLPRPGAWMETFRQLMAFPLFATALWLVSVFVEQVGIAGGGALMVALLVLAFTGWLWGRLQRTGRTGPAWMLLVALTAVPGVWVAHGATGLGEESTVDLWQPWTPALEARLRAEGRPVFVNFTAAWCISCKVNERVVFERDDVQAAFARNDVATLLADWTDRDDIIAATLSEYGREGVPLYLYHPPGRTGDRATVVLPSILTPDTLIATLDEQGANREE